MGFETLPVLHLDARTFPEYPSADPEQVLTTLARRFGRVVIVDVNGVRANHPDLEFVQVASRRRAVWVDAGSRYATDAMDLFIAGAETVTMRWNTLRDVEELEEAASLCQPGSLLLGLEFPRGGFLKHAKDHRDAAAVARLAEGLGLGLVYHVDANADERTLRALPESTTTRYVQGLAREQAAKLQDWGYHGALLAPTQLPEEAKE